MARSSIRNHVERYTEATGATVAAGATHDGASRDSGADGIFGVFRALVNSTQIGDLIIEQSRDGTTWRATDTVSLAAAGAKTLESKLVLRYARARFKNTAASGASVDLDTALLTA